MFLPAYLPGPYLPHVNIDLGEGVWQGQAPPLRCSLPSLVWGLVWNLPVCPSLQGRMEAWGSHLTGSADNLECLEAP